MQRISLYAALVIFLGALGLSWLTHGNGVVRDDPKHHISIPKQLTVPLEVWAAYNGTDVFFRYRWPAPNAGIFHDMLRYTNGAWVTQGEAVPGSQPEGLHEDRVAMMMDDGSVPEFGRYGGYVTIGKSLTGFSDEASSRDVKNHPYLGKKLGLDESTKYLPDTRKDLSDWAAVVPETEQDRLRAAGYFLDLWHWRAHRGAPVGYSDDQLVGVARLGDSGRGAYATNWDRERKQPRLMLDAAKVGKAALNWDDITQGRVGQDDVYYLREDQALPFDPNAGWKEGDTIPRRILRLPQGSRADISIAGRARWENGFWDVTLQRKMDTGKPLEDKILRDGGAYQVAFAIHRQATGGRWHYVSLPYTVGFGRRAEIQPTYFQGDAPDWHQTPFRATLFYPGQVSWPHLNSASHAGAERIKAGVPVRYRHTEEQLAHYGIEAEFAEAIKTQWRLTLLAGIGLLAAFGIALNLLIQRK
ncbi:ethylbenzene dehydrogenase-related protein [Ferrovibrio sp.]|uniref:ethylbenzene dehydrogenase-related protein n=1 Tax=Ferrovibrio sp. TaxID=1917215 RepID=UPI002602B0D0|nr:ethylbenzene dehydrogenase-related protein [Ferrovibrio sp.]